MSAHPESRVEPMGSAPTWWVVCARELSDLWIGGYAFILMILFCAVQGGIAYSLLGDIGRTPRPEMVYLMMETTVAVAVFMGVILGADTISGERERGTLEALLLTPASRRQILLGKFLAACSPWPAALLVSVPYFVVLSGGRDVFENAMLWGAVLGTLMVLGFTGLGMVVSFWSQSNKSSLFVALVMYFCFVVPTLLPWETQIGTFGIILRRVNPMESSRHLLDKVIVSNFPVGAYWRWLTSPILLALLVSGLLLYAGPRLKLESGTGGKVFQHLLFKKRRQPQVLAADQPG